LGGLFVNAAGRDRHRPSHTDHRARRIARDKRSAHPRGPWLIVIPLLVLLVAFVLIRLNTLKPITRLAPADDRTNDTVPLSVSTTDCQSEILKSAVLLHPSRLFDVCRIHAASAPVSSPSPLMMRSGACHCPSCCRRNISTNSDCPAEAAAPDCSCRQGLAPTRRLCSSKLLALGEPGRWPLNPRSVLARTGGSATKSGIARLAEASAV